MRIFLYSLLAVAFSTVAFAQNIGVPNIAGPAGISVNSLTGSLHLERTDLVIPGQGLPIDLSFSYNAYRDSADHGYGKGWTFAYDIRYTRDADTLRLQWGDGRTDAYTLAEDGSYVAPPGRFDAVTAAGDGILARTKFGMEYTFADPAHGRVTRVTDPNGEELRMTYTGDNLTTLADDEGRSVTFSYTAGRLTRITDANVAGDARTIDYAYDAEGRLTGVTEPLGVTTNYAYAEGRLVTITDANGQDFTILYHGNGRVSGLCSALSTLSISYSPGGNKTFVTQDASSGKQTTSYEFDERSRLIRKTGNCCGFNISYVYDRDNNVVAQTDANGNTFRYTYDARGNRRSMIDPLGNVTRFTYDPDFSQVTSVTDPNGHRVEMDYDEAGNLVEVRKPVDGTERFRYEDGRIVEMTDAIGNTVRYAYDENGYPSAITFPEGVEQYVYDAVGNLLSVTNLNGDPVRYRYDALNRVIRVEDALGNATEFVRDGNGNIVRSTDMGGTVKHYRYDVLNRLREVRTPAGSTQYVYDQVDNLVRVIDANGNDVQYTYDARNLRTSMTDGAGFVTRYRYDGNGNLTEQEQPNGNVISYTYDALDRLLQRAYPGGEDAYQYDGAGNLIRASNQHVSLTFGYDAQDRVISQRVNPWDKEIRYGYTATGKRATMTDPEGNVTRYAYDRNDRLASLEHPTAGRTTFGYDAAGRMVRRDNPNGTSAAYTFDAADRLVELTNGRAAGEEAISTFAYTHDGRGNRLSMTAPEGSYTYAYDSLHRVTEAAYPGGQVENYGYDGAGNRQILTRGGTDTDYTYDEADRLMTAGTARYRYDANGNLTAAIENGDSTAYTYDGENRLIRVALPGGRGRVEYAYDPFGQRISRTHNGETTYYLWDEENILQDLDAGFNPRTHYVATREMDGWLQAIESDAVYTYHQDALGSITEITNAQAEVVATRRYDAYGNFRVRAGDYPSRLAYAGREWDDAAGHYYYRTRYYRPDLGRFLTKDTYEGYFPEPLSLNKYAYAEGNPLLYTDPSGRIIFLAPFAVAGLKFLASAAIGAGINLAYQRYYQGRSFECTDWADVAISGALGGLGWTFGKAGGQIFKGVRNLRRARRQQHFTNYLRDNAIWDAQDMIIGGAAKLIGGALALGTGGKALFDATASPCEDEEGDQGLDDILDRILDDINILILRAFDPNDITGPAGVGPERWVSPTTPLPYTIRYENDPDFATAAAMNVRVTHDVSPFVDLNSFELGSYGFAGFAFTPPPNESFYGTALNTADSLGVNVDFAGGIDVDARRAFWNFTSLDAVSGLLPDDPEAGFLAVNDSLGSGEGFASFTVEPAAEAQTGDTIYARASIVFDDNEAIVTNRWFNTVDADAPVSAVEITTDGTTLTATTTASDLGSGLAGIDLYRTNAAGLLELLTTYTESSGTLTLETVPDSNYCFLSIATDKVGNAEAVKGEDTCGNITDTDEAGGDGPAVHISVFPNPTAGTLHIRTDLTTPRADLIVADQSGRALLRRTIDPRAVASVELGRLPGGVYLVYLEAAGGRYVRRVVRR